ncbi:MAG: hypothetical protein HY983_02945 [Candidatus Magasanikbacteria bacterium]|nr:hypothetical protein [Candidatus Magasanikbacteria bacterium]
MISSLFRRPRIFKIFAAILLISWYGFWLATPVVFTTGDLGRHLKNGEIFLYSLGNAAQLTALLHTNFYSSTFAAAPFINHHWATGVIFYIVWSLIGFRGLALFYAALSLLTFLIFFRVALFRAGWKITAPLAFFLIPLIAERVEIRPEGFSYLFAALFFLLLTLHSQGRVRFRTLLIALPILEMLWINFHIYFVFGLAIIGFFGAGQFFTQPDKRVQIKKFGALFLLAASAALLNPSGLNGFLFPLHIFQNYGIGVSENQPGWVLARQGFRLDNYPVFKITLALLAGGILATLLKKRYNLMATAKAGLPLASLGLAAVFGYLSWTAVRNYTFFGLFALPALATLAHELLPDFSKYRATSRKMLAMAITAVVIGATLIINRTRISDHTKEYGIGILPNSLKAEKFFTDHNLQGPIFNDFDIGGYLIYTLFPRERPFVDNRPEAYPASAFQEIFLPMQVSPDMWQKQEEKFHFNAIIFSLDDRAPWTLPFIVARLNDSTWAPVFADKSVIIFLKRNKLNEPVIKKFEIPNSSFGLRTVKE